jgi:hypothetical protein
MVKIAAASLPGRVAKYHQQSLHMSSPNAHSGDM